MINNKEKQQNMNCDVLQEMETSQDVDIKISGTSVCLKSSNFL